jgi:hypothetical protein
MRSIAYLRRTIPSRLANALSRLALIAATVCGMHFATHAAEKDPARESKKAIPARTAVLDRATITSSVRAQYVDWSGYRGIRRYSPWYLARYGYYPPYYYGNYAYRPWYARPYAYAWGYPAYAPPPYRYAPYGYAGFWPGYLPYAWGGPYPPPIAAPGIVAPGIVAPGIVAPGVVVARPQVSSTVPAADAEYVGCFYW